MEKRNKTWYTYLLEIDTYKNKLLFCNYTDNLQKGLWCILSHKYDNYINKFYKTNPKRVVYIEYVSGTEYDAMGRELEIKRMNVKTKRKLIISEKNKLIVYRPNNVIIIQDIDDCTKQHAIRMFGGTLF